MEVAAHVEALRHEGERMAEVVARTDPDTGVPTCPGWTVRDLVRHLGGVHRWATGYVVERRTEVWAVGLDEVVGTWPDDTALADWLREGCAVLADGLAGAPDDLDCWSFLPAPSPRAMWARRQAHETAVHRVDAELAATASRAPFPPAFAADGVDELLTCFAPRRSTGLRADAPVSLAVRCTDVDAAWVLRLGSDGVTTSAGTPPGGSGADASVLGAGGDLYLTLWNRAGTERLVVEGDRKVLDQFLGTVRVP